MTFASDQAGDRQFPVRRSANRVRNTLCLGSGHSPPQIEFGKEALPRFGQHGSIAELVMVRCGAHPTLTPFDWAARYAGASPVSPRYVIAAIQPRPFPIECQSRAGSTILLRSLSESSCARSSAG